MRIGIDLGGSKIEAIAMAENGEILDRRRSPTPRDDYRATLEEVLVLVGEVEAKLGRRGSVGVGIPGAISPASGLVKNANSTWLIGKPFDRDLSERLGRPVRVENDANCLATSEAVDGAGAGAKILFAVVLGTGVGGGIAIGGRPLTGTSAIAGEWGHNPLPWPDETERPGPPCYCGLTGCIETFLSGPGLLRDFTSRGDKAASAEEVAARAADGDPAAGAALARYEDRLARGLATVINLLDPEVIVLGGGLSNIGRLYEKVPLRLARYVFSDRVDTRIVPAKHGDSSGVRGAAWLWRPEELETACGQDAAGQAIPGQ